MKVELSIPKVWVVKSAFLRIVLQGKKIRVYEHAPADGAEYDEAVSGEGLVEVEHLHKILYITRFSSPLLHPPPSPARGRSTFVRR